MFFICGIDTRTKEIPYSKTVICAQCGGYGRYQVFMTYSCLSLFFIPIFKWNRHYYVRMSCCDTLYEMSQELGKRIAGGDLVDITESGLTLVQSGRRKENRWTEKKCCGNCGYETTEDFEYCPKCGQKF